MSVTTYFYVCNSCESEDKDEGPCKLRVDGSPGLPTECPFGIGFESVWIEVNDKDS